MLSLTKMTADAITHTHNKTNRNLNDRDYSRHSTMDRECKVMYAANGISNVELFVHRNNTAIQLGTRIATLL